MTASDQKHPTVNVGDRERLASLLGGGALALYGLVRGGLGGLALALLGGGLVMRGTSGHCEVYSALGINRADTATHPTITPQPQKPDQRRFDAVHQASNESFPASDPPAWIDNERDIGA